MKFVAYIFLIFYKLITFLIAPLGMLFLIYKKRHDKPYGNRKFELLGYSKIKLKYCIWFHTVSVGEVIAARPLIREFRERYKDIDIVVTTTTTTGAIEAQKIDGIIHMYAPLDSSCAINRFLKKVNPIFLYIMETELWPNMLDCVYKKHIPICVFNARMPEKTCIKYERYKGLTKNIISKKLSLVICQTKDDAERFMRIGVNKNKITVANSLKYDLKLDEDKFAKARSFKQSTNLNMVIGAISTHDNEEEMLIENFFLLREDFPNLKLVILPRHKDGAIRAIKFLEELKQPYSLRNNKDTDFISFNSSILIGSTIGEIEFYLGLCDIVFMGGSLVDVGGHNPLEPAYFALPIITGPYYYNFKDQFEELIDVRACFLANDPRRLYTLVDQILNNKDLCQKAGMQALDVQQKGRGAIQTTLQIFNDFMKQYSPKQ